MHCFDVLLANSTARASIVLPSNSLKYAFDNITISNAPTSEFHYYIQDHLGNNRVVMKESGAVEQITNYYPFGGVFSTMQSSYNTNSDHQPYKYNGKELDRRHGLDWYDYGARNYDAIVPMFTSVDPLCEKYYNISPYVYCANNPVMFVDPDGKKIEFAEGATECFKRAFSKAINVLKEHGLDDLYNKLEKSETIIYIKEIETDDAEFKPENTFFVYGSGEKTNMVTLKNCIEWNPMFVLLTTNDEYLDPVQILDHEMQHAYNQISNPKKTQRNKDTVAGDYENKEEKNVIKGREQKTAKKLRGNKYKVTRTDHYSKGSYKTSEYGSFDLNNLSVF